MIRTPPSQASATSAVVRPSCLPGQHRWQPTWNVGEFVCLRCGHRARCSMCVVVLPHTLIILHACPRHRMEDPEQASPPPQAGAETPGGQL